MPLTISSAPKSPTAPFSSTPTGATIPGFLPCWKTNARPISHFIPIATRISGKATTCARSRAPILRSCWPLRAFHDIGGSGGVADAYTIWMVQWVGQEIRILDYYESVGQVLAFHVHWMRERGYDKAINYLPHDGVNQNNVTGKTYADHWRDAGFTVEPPVKNQGKGAAMMRIEALRRLSAQLWFNEATTEAGRDALGFYHERKDDVRNIGLG